MKTLLATYFLLFVTTSFSQTLRPEAKRVKVAYDNLILNKSDEAFKAAYIASFPADSKTFLSVFNPPKLDQLYSNSHKYLEALKLSAQSFPKEVIGKCVNIGKNLIWDADAVGQLQHLSVHLAAKHPSIFINKYKTLTTKEQNKLTSFYADVENHSAYKIYQDLIDILKRTGGKEIAAELETARALRKERHDH